MAKIVLTYLVGLLGGIAVGLQSPISGAMGQKIGGTAGSFIIHLGGLICSGVLLALRGGENIREWRVLPWYMLGSGVLGLVLFLTLNHTMPRLGASAAVTLIIVGQLLMGLLIDHFGLFGATVRSVDVVRLLAAALLLIGSYLIVSR